MITSTIVAFDAAFETFLNNSGPQMGGLFLNQIHFPSAAVTAEPLLQHQTLCPRHILSSHALLRITIVINRVNIAILILISAETLEFNFKFA